MIAIRRLTTLKCSERLAKTATTLRGPGVAESPSAGLAIVAQQPARHGLTSRNAVEFRHSIIDQDHGPIKRRCAATAGFESYSVRKRAECSIRGIRASQNFSEQFGRWQNSRNRAGNLLHTFAILHPDEGNERHILLFGATVVIETQHSSQQLDSIGSSIAAHSNTTCRPGILEVRNVRRRTCPCSVSPKYRGANTARAKQRIGTTLRLRSSAILAGDRVFRQQDGESRRCELQPSPAEVREKRRLSRSGFGQDDQTRNLLGNCLEFEKIQLRNGDRSRKRAESRWGRSMRMLGYRCLDEILREFFDRNRRKVLLGDDAIRNQGFDIRVIDPFARSKIGSQERHISSGSCSNGRPRRFLSVGGALSPPGPLRSRLWLLR